MNKNTRTGTQYQAAPNNNTGGSMKDRDDMNEADSDTSGNTGSRGQGQGSGHYESK